MNILFFTGWLFHTNLLSNENQVANFASVVMELGFRRPWVPISSLLHPTRVSWESVLKSGCVSVFHCISNICSCAYSTRLWESKQVLKYFRNHKVVYKYKVLLFIHLFCKKVLLLPKSMYVKKAWLLCSTQSSGKTDTQRAAVGAVMEMCTRYNKT